MQISQSLPHVAIIIPCYNQAQYLPFAIRSVLAQTYCEWELVIVDDGSTDATKEVAAQFVDSRIRYYYQENQGLSAARNSGIRQTEGEFLAFLDADDGWKPRFLERCCAVLQKDESLAFVYTENLLIDANGKDLPRTGGEVVPPEIFRTRLLEGGFFSVNAVVLRRKVLSEKGLFDTALTSVEDWDLWLRVSEQHLAHGIKDTLAQYRVYPGSMSTDASRMHENRMAVLAKHFGAPEGQPAQWDDEKRRAYGFAYRAAALGYIAQGSTDVGWGLLDKATEAYPQLNETIDTYYELACFDQNRVDRGTPASIDLSEAENRLVRWIGYQDLVGRFDSFGGCRGAIGTAFLALTMLSNQQDQPEVTRRYLKRALGAKPSLIFHKYVLFQLAKQSLVWAHLWEAVQARFSKTLLLGLP